MLIDKSKQVLTNILLFIAVGNTFVAERSQKFRHGRGNNTLIRRIFSDMIKFPYYVMFLHSYFGYCMPENESFSVSICIRIVPKKKTGRFRATPKRKNQL